MNVAILCRSNTGRRVLARDHVSHFRRTVRLTARRAGVSTQPNSSRQHVIKCPSIGLWSCNGFDPSTAMSATSRWRKS